MTQTHSYPSINVLLLSARSLLDTILGHYTYFHHNSIHHMIADSEIM